ncbi:MAG TPA: argininosuccinate lyase [Firmicutes bacterium]|nr:argininosuccinate lyase [Bacillota bacterium]
MPDKPWGGRFDASLDKKAEAFLASLPFDQRLAQEDVRGSMAHCRMLIKTGVLSPGEGELILGGLVEIAGELASGRFPFDLSLEDIHMNVEKRLMEKIGSVGGKLHTGRSRNDQVALDMHLYVRKQIIEVDGLLAGLQAVLLELAKKHLGVIIPGYTHLQRAQPVIFSHHLLAYFWMLQRDRERFLDAYRRADLMPLGAGALSGSSFPLDREAVARELHFAAIYENSMDAVSDRDFVLEFLACAALLIMHLSRLSEELILWSSQEFSFIELSDAFTTGSSMMPQKKNPDIPELVRGKAGRVYGNLLALLTVFKGLPLTYNKDMQEDKEPLFDTCDTIKNILEIYPSLLESTKLNLKQIKQAVQHDFSTVTELADYLAANGIPFREAHAIVGQLVRYALDQGKLPAELTRSELAPFHPLLDSDMTPQLLRPQHAVASHRSRGGTAPQAVKEQLSRARRAMHRINLRAEKLFCREFL